MRLGQNTTFPKTNKSFRERNIYTISNENPQFQFNLKQSQQGSKCDHDPDRGLKYNYTFNKLVSFFFSTCISKESKVLPTQSLAETSFIVVIQPMEIQGQLTVLQLCSGSQSTINIGINISTTHYKCATKTSKGPVRPRIIKLLSQGA